MQKQPGRKVTLITDMDDLFEEITPQPIVMIRPQLNRRYAYQRMMMTAEVVDLSTLNLAYMPTFETV